MLLYPEVPLASGGYNRDVDFLQTRTRYESRLPDIVVTHDPTEFYTISVHYQNISSGEAATLNQFHIQVVGMAGEFDFFDLWNRPFPWLDLEIGTTTGIGPELFQIPAKNVSDVIATLDGIPVSFLYGGGGINGRNVLQVTSFIPGQIVGITFSGWYCFKASFLSSKLPFENDGFQYSFVNNIQMLAKRNDRSIDA